jgi:transposase InsO family protein
MPVERERALDSWFMGYMWTPIFYGCSKNNSNLHIGWKFTSVNENNNGGNNEFFYALIIDINKGQKTGWMVTHIMTEL